MEADLRYSFTTQFLQGAAMFTRRARAIEELDPSAMTEQLRVEHKACVVAALMQAAASLESEIYEVITHGPGHHLGSDRNDRAAVAFLKPLADAVDHQPTLDRYVLVLHLLRKPPLDTGAEPYQSADLLMRARNEIVHYKSRWGKDMEGKKVYARLERLRLREPPFATGYRPFFPGRFLSSSAATWATSSAAGFICHYFSLLGFVPPIPPLAHLELPALLHES